MASISISEDDFLTLAMAAGEAKDAGDMELARKLDKMARKVNAALSSSHLSSLTAVRVTGKPSWQDMPSLIGD